MVDLALVSPTDVNRSHRRRSAYGLPVRGAVVGRDKQRMIEHEIGGD